MMDGASGGVLSPRTTPGTRSGAVFSPVQMHRLVRSVAKPPSRDGEKRTRLRINPVIHIGKQIMSPFDLAEPGIVDIAVFDFFVQTVEVDDVGPRAFPGVVHHGSGLHDESPVA